MTLTKSNIINGIYNSTDLTLHQATKTVENLLKRPSDVLSGSAASERNSTYQKKVKLGNPPFDR